MVKLEWGSKRTCQDCNSRFYDMGRSPISCPKCGTIFEVVTTTRAKRGRGNASDPLKGAGRLPVGLEDSVLVSDLDLADELETGLQDEEGDLIEDADELGEEDLDDLSEVLDESHEDDH